ncbi:hypothetical protein Droror1_Dr00021678 [Drosera rotundifolia]
MVDGNPDERFRLTDTDNDGDGVVWRSLHQEVIGCSRIRTNNVSVLFDERDDEVSDEEEGKVETRWISEEGSKVRLHERPVMERTVSSLQALFSMVFFMVEVAGGLG